MAQANSGLTPREEKVRAAILEDAGAKHSFRWLIKKGFEEQALLTLLTMEAWGPGVVLDRKAKWNRYALTRAESREKADRLLRLARRLRKETRLFPHVVLDHCAGQLIRVAASLRRDPAWLLPPNKATQSQSTLNFLEEVKRRTGYQSLNHVAALLRVTHTLAGRGEHVSRESLRSMRKTHKAG